MKAVKRIACLVLCCLTVMSFCSCGKSGEARSYFVNKKVSTVNVSADAENKELYYCAKSKKKLQKICQSGMLEMYFDKDTYSVYICDGATGSVYRSLPQKYVGEKTASVFVHVLIDGNRYTLDSQSDSVAFSSALYEVGEDSVKVNYSFKRTLDKNVKISFNIPVEYSLRQGVFSVEIDCENLVNDDTGKNVVLESISVLPFFGSSEKGEKGDFILVPDGCGTVIDLSKNPEKFSDVKLDVYGGDKALTDKESSVLTGAFGMKSAAAFLCFIESGDSVAQIRAEKALKNGGNNQVYANFKITPTAESEEGVYVSEFSYKGKIKLSYRFLSKEADYVTMAGVLREMLIRSGVLSGIGVSEQEEYPFNLRIDFTDSGNTVTDILQCEEILSSLKAKGVKNISLIANNLVSVSGNDLKVDSELGSSKQFSQLINILKADGVKLYTDSSLYAPLKEDNALNIKGDSIDGAAGAQALQKNAEASMYALRQSDFDGIYIDDAGKWLYSDFSSDRDNTAQQRAESVSQLLGAFSSFENVYVSRGNFYSLKYAHSVTELPHTSSLEGKALCTDVPFVQAVLHGEVNYSLSPVNLEKDSVKAMLKCVEYGAVPYYSWHYSDLSDGENKDSGYYMNSINQAQLLYQNAKELFSDLLGARITAHKQISKNLYMTQYDDTTKIYVNYGKSPVNVDGVTVDAKSFLRVG